MSQPTAPVLSFTFPIERAGNAIQSLPAGTYTIKTTGLATKLHKVAELAGALGETSFENGCKSSEKRIHLDLTELEGLQFIGRWGTRFSKENSEYSGFRNASYLVSINLPLGIEFIGNDVFSGCTNLKELVIPDGVESIGDNAFGNCSSLEKIEMKGETPPDVSEDSFPRGVTIYVPAASVEDYRRKLPYNHIEAIEDN